jgi:hypothetical protein
MIGRSAVFAAALTAGCVVACPAAAQRMAGAQATSIAGVVFDSLRTKAPLAGATVVLIELNKYVSADERGRFHFDSLVPGRYRLSFLHPVLDSLHITASETEVDAVAGTATVVRLVTPSAASLYARLCPAPREKLTGVVIGRVYDVDDDSPLAGAVVSSAWDELVIENGTVRGHTAGHRVVTTASGGFVFCGVPSDAPFKLRASAGGASAGPIEVSLGTSLVASADLAVSRAPAGAARLATLRGSVRRTDGTPLAGAIISSDAATVPARADAAGRFTLAGIVPGTRVVEVKALGLNPLTLVMDFRSGMAIDTAFTLIRPAQPLSPVAVSGRSDEIDRGEFDRRRQSTAGYFATQADIMKFAPGDLGEVFQRVPSLRLQPGPPRAGVNTRQVTMMGSGGNPYCVPTFFIDGVEFAGGGVGSFAEVMDAVKPEMVKGIEVYRPGSPIPPRFDRTSRTGCGSIVVWTR